MIKKEQSKFTKKPTRGHKEPSTLCTVCQKPTLFTNLKLCQSCYSYFSSGGVIHPLPPKGEVHYSQEGYPICHICGKAYAKLGNHIHLSHHITTREYKEEFELCFNTQLTSAEYHNHMRKLNIEQNMPEILPQLGIKTRFQPNQITGYRRSCLQENNIRQIVKQNKKS